MPLAVIACKKPDQATPEGGGKRGGRGGGGEGGVAFAVDLLQVEKKKVDYVVTAPGTIEAFERVQVTARVAGAVDRVAFREGQEVKKGDVLVTIDGERFRLAVNSANAQLEKAQAAQKDVEAQVARREGASEKNPGLIPGEELETYRTKVLTAKADTAVAAEALKVAELNLRDSAVRAPIEGTIQTRTVETGQYVQTGYVMATLLKSDPMLLRFQVEPPEAPRLKPGMSVGFTMRETQRAFTAKVSLVAGAADVGDAHGRRHRRRSTRRRTTSTGSARARSATSRSTSARRREARGHPAHRDARDRSRLRRLRRRGRRRRRRCPSRSA